MQRWVTALCTTFALLCVPWAVTAQRTTGDIRGVVSDESGAVLPGATVTLKGPAVAGTPSTVSNEAGIYRFANLAPGVYELSVELSGFTTKTQTGIQVSLGGTVELNVQLGVSTQQETITVTAEAPVVSSTSTQVATNYSREWVENAPVRRFTFFDLINAAPGVSPAYSTDSRSQAFGSATNENLYLLDGTDFTAPLTGAAWPWPNTDAIEEVQVLSLGAPADYGNLGGAVFNIVTRQGSNAFRGDANFYYQNQSLTSRNTTDDQDDGLPYNRSEFKDSTVQLGGPIAKDKLWFFGSFQYQKDADSQPGTDPEFPARSSAKRYFYKINYQVAENHRVQFQMHDDFYRIPIRATASDAPSSVKVETGHNPSPGLMWSSVFNETTLFEARYSGFYGVDHGDPLNGGPRVARRYKDLDTGQITGGIYSWYDGKSAKTAFSGKLTKYADNFLGGSHDFKLGVQYNSGLGEYAYGLNDYIYTYGTEVAYGYTQLPYYQGGRMKALGVYVDDSWQIGRANINAGIRYDDSKAYFRALDLLDAQGNPTGQKSQAVDEVFRWRVVSPRFGVNFKVNEAGTSLLKAHYGRYYRSIVTGEFDNTTPSITPRYLFSGFYNAAGVPLDLDLVSDNSTLSVDPDLKNPYTDQYILAWEQQLGTRIGFSVNYVHKRGENQTAFNDVGGTYSLINYTGAPAGADVRQVFRLTSSAATRRFQLVNDDRMFTRYNGVAFELRKRMSNRWQGNIGLTLSKSTGRLGSSSARSSPLTRQSSTAGVFGQNPNDYINSDGRLAGDRPMVLKVQFLYELPWNMTTSFNFQSQSGRVIYSEIRVPTSVTAIPGASRIVATKSDGEDRTPLWQTLDMRIEKAINLGGTAEAAVFGDFLNLFNSDTSETVLDRRIGNSNYLVPARFVLPRRLMVGAKFRF